ncbi:hypothetical protein [Runella sp.]|uniref:hypothetical protein n=1 Tax=Runella sp. TaxID=1960881 RepID=UPI0030197B7C
MRNYIYLSIFVLLLAGCQKAQDGLSGSSNPVFFMDAKGISLPILYAGVGSYYMFTRYSTENQKFKTIGTLGLVSCENGDCQNSLHFEITYPLSVLEQGVDSIFHLGYYAYKGTNGQDSIVKRLVLSAEPHELVDSLVWSIDQTIRIVGDSAKLDFPQSNVHFVELQTIKNGALRSRVTGKIDMAGQKTFPMVRIAASYDTVALTNGFNLQAVSIGSPIVSYKWSNDSTHQSFFDQGFGLTTGAIEVVAADAQAEIATAKLAQLSSGENIRKTTGFSYTIKNVNLGTSGALNGVAIQWIDAGGNTWRSDWGNQNADQFFRVINSLPYDLNEKGLKTRKIDIYFKCLLYNALGEVKALEGEGTIGMAYP